MTGIARWDLACFSYLACATVLHVSAYPKADTGAAVVRSHVSLAGDGPIAATLAAQRGFATVLVANPMGHDSNGQVVSKYLAESGVRLSAPAAVTAHSPQLTVITDHAGTRTWLADLHEACAVLRQADVSPLRSARLAYVDCYSLIASESARAIRAAASAGVPVIMNLGNDELHPAVAAAAQSAVVFAVQTGLPEEEAAKAPAAGADLLSRVSPRAAVVTLGSLGVYARTKDEEIRVSARPVRVRDTHGAGAAFSAGLATAYLEGSDLRTALQRACEEGTQHCVTPPELYASAPRERNVS